MADKATIDAVGTAAPASAGGGAGNNPSKLWSIPGSFEIGNQRMTVNRIELKGHYSFEPKHGIPAKKLSVIKLHGTGLGLYDRVAFGALKTILKNSGSTDEMLSFTVPDFGGSVKDGGNLWLSLLSKNRSQINRAIAPYFVYSSTKEEDEDKSEDGKAKGGSKDAEGTSGGPGPAELMMAALGDTVKGVAGAVAAGLTGGGPAKQPAAAPAATAASPKSKEKKPEAGADDDAGGPEEVEGEEEQKAPTAVLPENVKQARELVTIGLP